MLATKEIRQEPMKKIPNGKKDSKDIFLVNNPTKETYFKQQNEITNIKTNISHGIKPNESTALTNNIMPEISSMQIDSECPNLKKTNLNKEDHKSIETEIEKNKTHKDKLNEILIINYGPEIYEFSMELEKLAYFPNSLKKHKIEPEIRTKMIDWMIEVLSAYNSDPQTFSLAVQIMDLYIAKSQNVLTNNDVHLLGIVSMYIASKMEDIIPLRMNHVKSKISHNKFSEKEIKRKEKNILETIDFETITSSTYDFIRTFVFDFIHNNRIQIHKLNMFHHIDVFDNVAIFLSKLIYHNEDFSNYK